MPEGCCAADCDRAGAVICTGCRGAFCTRHVRLAPQRDWFLCLAWFAAEAALGG